MFAARVAASERVYAVGDIHGRIDLLERMLALIAADSAACSDGRRPRLVFLGDYIDRGDESRAVLARLAAAAHEHDNGC
jgi:serine/threonine protein phosphatase 1